jgi:hypothetical protein
MQQQQLLHIATVLAVQPPAELSCEEDKGPTNQPTSVLLLTEQCLRPPPPLVKMLASVLTATRNQPVHSWLCAC